MRSTNLGSLLLLALSAVACSGNNDEVLGVGGTNSTAAPGGSPQGGATGTNPGSSIGGARTTGGTSTAPLGGNGGSVVGSTGGISAGGSNTTSGGSPNTGGAASNTGGTPASAGGAKASGGTTTSTGGAKATGGTTSSAGGTAAGGASTGGKSTGGSGTGGSGTGGSGAGGKAVGGTSTGGAATGGSGTCTWPEPPSTVSAWVNESWNAQLGTNIKGRQAWLIDNAMKGKGQINLCMRWGATKAPTAAQKTGMSVAVEQWFNLWFSQLDGYGCFPYPKITVKVTGWAVKPGNTSWLSDIDTTTTKIYTEVDGSGEPKCPDSCSFFSNWSHSFPSCPGGEAFHHDYWFWIDDTNAAAAEGGDWGLRMPVASLNNAMANVAYDVNTVIHEMGHGFGFQDYYDWTGATPAGGSLMIVGPNTTSPTVGDTWLIRRTWKEMKTLRGW